MSARDFEDRSARQRRDRDVTGPTPGKHANTDIFEGGSSPVSRIPGKTTLSERLEPATFGVGAGTSTNASGAGVAAVGTAAAQRTFTWTTPGIAPGSGDQGRSTVGVGERIKFTAQAPGRWTATRARRPDKLRGEGAEFEYLAPATAGHVTITFQPGAGGPAETAQFTVVAPSGVDFLRKEDQVVPAAGALMVNFVRFTPLTVSFDQAMWLELPSNAEGRTGYFRRGTLPAVAEPFMPHTPANEYLAVNSQLNDQAGFRGFPRIGSQWAAGTFHWTIPNYYRVQDTSADNLLATVTQAFTIAPDGSVTVTKGSQSHTQPGPGAAAAPTATASAAAAGAPATAGRGGHGVTPELRSGLQVQRQAVVTAGVAGGVAIPPTVIVEDQGAQVSSGQLRKTDFLLKVEPLLRAAAKEVLGAAWDVAGCPYIAKYLALFRDKPAADVEKFVRRYTGSTAGEVNQLLRDVIARVKVGVTVWKETHTLPADLVQADPVAAKAAEYGAPPIQRKADNGQASGGQSKPAEVLERLGDGAPLDPSTQARMERAFGTSFSDVRIHTDSHGNALAQEHSALAFAVGSHVAFAPGRYQPGSVEGDALLAHELTHVLQQRGATASASKDVSEVGDASEKDADRGAANAVAQLHGGANAAGDKATSNVSSDLQLQRCSSLNENEQAMIEEQQGFWRTNPSWEGDKFAVIIKRQVSAGTSDIKNIVLNVDIAYDGADDTDHHQVSIPGLTTTHGKALAPKMSTDTTDAWRTLTIDPHGDASLVHTVKHSVRTIDGWNPKSREHLFSGTSPHMGTPYDKTITVKSKDALPGTATTTTTTAADANVQALRIDVAATSTKTWLDELVTDPTFAINVTAAPWAALKAKVDADAAKYTSNVVDAHDEALKLTRLGQVLSRARPMLKALGAASKKEAYLPDIAVDCLVLIAHVREQYATGIAAAWDGPATAELGAADAAFNAVWYRISSLYMEKGRGVDRMLGDSSMALEDVRTLRGAAGGRPGTVWPQFELEIGVPGSRPAGAGKTPGHEAQDKADKIRDKFVRGDTGALGDVKKIVEDTQVIAGLAALLSTTEIMYSMRKEMEGIVGTVADKLPGTTNLTKKCTEYIGKFEKISRGVENDLKAGKNIFDIGPGAVKELQGICNDEFKKDCDDIKSRIKTVATINALAKVLAIVGVAALTGGAAGAAVGGMLEGLGAGAGIVATGEFVAEVAAFTYMSRRGNDVAFGGNQTGPLEDLVTNALMFGFLKAAAAGYGRVFKVFADPRAHKTAFAVGGAMTGMVGLQVFAEIHARLKTGKWMDNDERAVGILSNAVMLVCMSLGGYLAKPQAERIRQDMLVFAAKNVPGALEKIEGKLGALKGELEGLKGKSSPKDLQRTLELLEKVEKLWNEQLSVLAEAAKVEKTQKTEAAKAFQEQVQLMVKEIAKLDLQLSAAGVEVQLGTNKGGNFFRPLSPGYVAFRESGLEVLRDFYKENGGTFGEVKDKPGMYVGKDSSGEMFFVQDDVASSFFDRPVLKPPTEAEARANRAAAEKAKIENVERAKQLRRLLGPTIQDGHCTHKFGRVISGTGLAAAMDANTLPGAAHGEKVAPLEELPPTIGVGSGKETFAKLGDTPVGQAAPEISGGGGWAQGASPADMTSNHGNYTSAASIADAVALTQLRSGVPILDASVQEVSLKPDGTWKVPDAKVRIKLKLADGSEIYIYSDATDIATGLGPPRELDKGQISADPTKEAQYKAKLQGDGRLVYGDSVGVQKGGDKVLVSGGSATGAWNAKVARALGALVDWIAKDSGASKPPRSEHNARKYKEVQDKLNSGELTQAEADKQMADLRAFDAAALPRNVQAADSAMQDSGITRHVKEIASLTPTEDIAGEQPGRVKVTFTDGTSGVYDQVVVSHGTNLGAEGKTPGALSLAKGIEMKPVVVDGQVVALESVNPPGAVRVVGAAMWSRAWLEYIPEALAMDGKSARDVYSNALDNQAKNSPRDSPGNPLIFNTGQQIPAANKAIGGGPDIGGVKGSEVYRENTILDPTTNKESVKTLSAADVKSGVDPLDAKEVSQKAKVIVTPGTVTENGASMKLTVPTSSGDRTVNVTLRIKKAGDLKVATTHGGDAGPARLELTWNTGAWDANIEISSAVKAEDLPFVLRHELNETVEVVRRNPGGAPKDSLGAQMDSVLMKKGAAKGATPTAHDVAGALEIIELFKDWQRLEAAKAPEAAHRKGVLDRAMEAQGLNENLEVAAKQDLLKSNGAPQELIDQVGKGPWKAPKSWNGPASKGEWLGARGDSGWVSTRPEVIRVVGRGPDGRANPIIFRQGKVDFSPYVLEELTVTGLNGEHAHDMKLIRLEYAKQHSLATGKSDSAKADAALDAMRDANDGHGGKGLAPHHAGGDKIQMIPKAVHKIQHTDVFDYSSD